jgi:antitoxin component YwqK of YwqJK toxin-antitoxin module
MASKKIALLLFLFYHGFVNSQNLTMIELLQLSNKPNWEAVNSTLTAKGWEYYDSKKGDDTSYDVVTWALNKNNYNEKAQGWFMLYTYTGLPNKVSYQFRKKATYDNLKAALSSNGFKYVDSDVNDNEVTSNYYNAFFFVELQYLQMPEDESSYSDNTHTSYVITVIKKAGIYDKDNGAKKTFYDNGNVQNEYNLKDGKLQGVGKNYFEDGTLKIISTFSNGKRNGPAKEYEENGQLIGEYNYLNDELNGPYKLYENNHLSLTGNFKLGKKNGFFRAYNDRNKILKEFNLLDDMYNGKYVEYFYNDTVLSIKITGQYDNNEKNGIWQMVSYKNKKEDLLDSKNYINGILNGSFKEVRSDSIIFGQYSNGELNGKYSVYTTTRGLLLGEITGDTTGGILLSQGSYYNGKESGPWKGYYLTGLLRFEGAFRDGERSGEWKFYYDNHFDKNQTLTSYSKEIYSIQNYDSGQKSGKSLRFSYLEQKKKLCDTLGNNLNPLDSCFELVYEKVNEISYYKNDLLHGPFERKDSDGKIILKGSFVEGLKEGEWLESLDNGGMVNLVFKNGKINGKIIYRDSLSRVVKEGFYENDEPTGKWNEYDKNGQVLEEYNFKRGKLDGIMTSYNQRGQLQSTKGYENGTFLICNIYDSLGKRIIRKYEIIDRQKRYVHCKRTKFYIDGAISQVFRLNKDIDEEIEGDLFEFVFMVKLDSTISGSKVGYADGDYKEYDVVGNIVAQGKYFKKNKIGSWRFDYPAIGVRKEQNFTDDIGGVETFYDNKTNTLFSGKFILKNSLGKKTVEFKIEEGLRNGKSKYFDESGDVTNTERYEKGILSKN